MMVLVDIANGKQRHVPYRDSKLTFLLQVTTLFDP
jgi:kinesin family protein 15